MKRILAIFGLLLGANASVASNFYLDTFSGTVGTALSAHTGDLNATYTKSTGNDLGESTLSGSNSLVSASGATITHAYYAVTGSTPSTADYTVEANVTVALVGGTVKGGFAIGVRMDNNCSTAGYIFAWTANTGQYILYSNATATTLASTTVTPSVATHVFKIATVGTAITCYVDGVSTLTATDSSTTSVGKPMLGHFATAASQSSFKFTQNEGYLTPTPLTSGTASVVAFGSTTATVTVGTASGGIPSYSYQWYRSTSSGFTPGGGNIVGGATSQTLVDTGLTTATTYYYKNVVTDSDSPTPSTATSNEISVTPTAGRAFAF